MKKSLWLFATALTFFCNFLNSLQAQGLIEYSIILEATGSTKNSYANAAIKAPDNGLLVVGSQIVPNSSEKYTY